MRKGKKEPRLPQQFEPGGHGRRSLSRGEGRPRRRRGFLLQNRGGRGAFKFLPPPRPRGEKGGFYDGEDGQSGVQLGG